MVTFDGRKVFPSCLKEGKMGRPEERKDIVEKDFVTFPDITADVINVLLYQGKNVIKKENLLSGPTEIIYQGNKKLRTQYEDLCKYEMSDGKIRLMYLIANQSKTDGKMLLRKAGYTGGIYREQYEEQMTDIFPVIELVLYWGTSKWRSSRDFRRLFRKRNLSEAEWGYIDELKLHVYEMRHLPEKTRKLFQSDMRIVVDFLAEGEKYYSNRKIVHKAALIKMIKVLSGETDTSDVEKWMEEQNIREEDEITVCELFDQYERKGELKGRKIGVECGEARRLVADIESVMHFFHVTLEKACEGLGTTVNQYEEAKKLV